MTPQMYDKILSNISYDGEMAWAFKKLWRNYQQLRSAMIYNQQPTINIYYDKPKELSTSATGKGAGFL